MTRDDYNMPKLKLAQARRQAMLDHLRAHPLATYPDLVAVACVAAGDIPPNTVRGYIAYMLENAEIAAAGTPRARRYIALVDTTISAERIREQFLERQRRNNYANAEAYAERKRQARTKGKPTAGTNGGRVYHSGDNPEIARFPSGGQGSLVRAAIGSGMYGGIW